MRRFILPILALVSKENQTGKTIFWRWCVAIFQQNTKIIPPEMLTGNFTEYFPDRCKKYCSRSKIKKWWSIKSITILQGIKSEGTTDKRKRQ